MRRNRSTRTKRSSRSPSKKPEPPTKKLRSQEPDIVVVVGSGKKKQEFECYKLFLCYACEYFDTMFSHGLKENETSRIELPDKDPDEWKIFYEFIDPSTIMSAKVTNENALMLAPWFSEYGMDLLKEECDEVISKLYFNLPFMLEEGQEKQTEGLLDFITFCEQCPLNKSLLKGLQKLGSVMIKDLNVLVKKKKIWKRVLEYYQSYKGENSLDIALRECSHSYTFYQDIGKEKMDWTNRFYQKWIESKVELLTLQKNGYY